MTPEEKAKLLAYNAAILGKLNAAAEMVPLLAQQRSLIDGISAPGQAGEVPQVIEFKGSVLYWYKDYIEVRGSDGKVVKYSLKEPPIPDVDVVEPH